MSKDSDLIVKLKGGQWSGKSWRVLWQGQIVADDLPYKEVKPLILGKVNRKEFLARYGQEVKQ